MSTSGGWTTQLALHRQLYHTEKQSTQSMRAWRNSIRELARKTSDLGEDNYEFIIRDDPAKLGNLSCEFTDAVLPRTHRLRVLLLRVVYLTA